MEGKIISIPIRKPYKGMQVAVDSSGGLLVATTVTDFDDNYINTKNGSKFPYQGLKLIVIQFLKDGKLNILPLESSQWQMAINNYGVDTNETINFETFDTDTEPYFFAKIVPKQPRLYTEDELRNAMKYASSHNSSLNGINKYIDDTR